ncbi:NAD(P)/FAD-dependent oxidoreductase [Halomonas denitrificans]|nr:FAD-binding oxidoreductase [Halomonas denitrificans]
MPTGWPRFHSPTWYEDRIAARRFPRIESDRSVRVAVIGAGLAGLSTAFSLLERGHRDVVVLEAGQPGEGASGRNGGFVFGGFSLGPEPLVRRVGLDRARVMQRWTHEAVDRVRGRCAALGVSLDGEGVLLADWFRNRKGLDALRDAIHRATGLELLALDRAQRSAWVCSDRYGGGLLEPGAFHFNPLAYVRALADELDASGLSVHGDSAVERIERAGGGWRLRTRDATVRADRVVVSTGGYDRRLVPRLVRSIHPIGTYVAVTEPLPGRLEALIPGTAAVYDTRFAFDYYRRIGDRLLWGGRISIADRDPDAIEALMRRDVARVFPSLADVRFTHSWGGWMSYARHQMPILGELEPGLWAASAFGGHGMAPTTMAGEVIAEALDGEGDRLEAFRSWGPSWAGGPLGRWTAQASYWAYQARDAIRAWRSSG